MAADPMTAPLSPEEIQEAQYLGIIPGTRLSARGVLPLSINAANGGQVSARVPTGGTPAMGPTAPVGRRPVPAGPDYVPRVQLDPATAPQSPLSQSIAASREKYTRELDALNQPPDYSQLQQQQRERTGAARDDMFASALAGIGPEAVQGFQQPLLKHALAARQPLKIEGGQIDESGRVMLDPAFQQNKKIEALRGRLAQLDALEARIASDADKAALVHERNMIMTLIAQIRASQGGQQGSATWGFTAGGNRIVERNGVQFEEMPDGSFKRFIGVGTPKTNFEKNAQSAMQLQGSIARSDALLEQVDKNPKAFGLAASVTSMLPDIIQQRVMPKVLNADQLAVRNYVQRQAADEIHQIYGAALTMGEGMRAAQWAIGPKDSFESTMSKLHAARAWAMQTVQGQGTAANNAAASRLNNGGQPPANNLPGGIPAPGGAKLPNGWSVREKPGG